MTARDPTPDSDLDDVLGRAWSEMSPAERARYAAPGTEAKGPVPVLNTVTLDTVRTELVEWLWPGRLPYGKLWLLDGHPGTGKSFVTLELAACVTTGRALPGARPALPEDVVIVNLEDGLGDTIRPRAEAAGADLKRLHAITSVTDTEGHERPPRLPDDVPLIRTLVERTGARLLVIDPLTAYLGGEVDSYKDADMRRALLPPAAMADELGIAVLVVRHLTKRQTGVAILAGGGSMGIIGIARGGLMLAKDPDDPTRRVLAVSKNNLAPEAPAMMFTLEDDGLGPRVHWQGESAHTADSLVAPAPDNEQKTAVEEAVDLLRSWLEGGPLDRKGIMKLARDAGISERTMDRAKTHAGVVTKQQGAGLEKRSLWSLPDISPILATAPYSGGNGGDGTQTGPKSHDESVLAFPPTAMAGMDETHPFAEQVSALMAAGMSRAGAEAVVARHNGADRPGAA